MKNIAVFLDGTWNDKATGTNVFRLYSLVSKDAAGGIAQATYYDAGVGTHWYDKLVGGALGEGLSENVQDAYRFVRKNYEDGDHVFIFGFSRGAYTARSLGGLIAACGLAQCDAPFDVGYLYQRYRNRKDRATPIYELQFLQRSPNPARPLTAEELRLLAHSRRIDIHMIGVWDTVGALGIPWTGMPFIGKDNFYFHNPNLSKIYKNAFQALAIDENRGAYKPTLWTLFRPESPSGAVPAAPPMPSIESVEQRWFIGAHANVGGGYPNDQLPMLPLSWMQQKAKHLGLNFTAATNVKGDEQRTKPVDSYAQFLGHAYQLLTLGQRYHRPIGTKVNKVNKGWSFPVNEVIDASVFDRCRYTDCYRPKNLLDWAARKGAQLSTIQGDQIA